MAPSPAALAKEKGNAAFTAADYPAAVGHYTAAVLADPSDPTFPLNRAAAYLKLNKHQDAERDCTRVLALSPTNVKALFRRAQARAALSLLDPARQDLQNALALQPANDAVAAELRRVDALAAQALAKAKAKSKTPKDISPSTSTSVPPPTTQPPKPKRRRIPITIVEPEPASTSTSASSAPTPTPTLPALPAPTSFKDAKRARDSAKPSVVGATTTAAPPASTPHPRPNAPADPPPPAPRARGGVFRASGAHTLFPASPPAAASPSAAPAAAASAPIPTPSRAPATPAPANAAPTTTTTTTRAKPPMTLFAFTRAWEREADPAARWALLCQIPPPALPALFQTSLEPALLTSLLTTFLALLFPPPSPAPSPSPSPSPSANDGDDDDEAAPALRRHIRAYMAGLARTPRFATVVLLMSRAERARVADVWAALRADDGRNANDRQGDGDGDGALLEEEARRWGV